MATKKKKPTRKGVSKKTKAALAKSKKKKKSEPRVGKSVKRDEKQKKSS